MECIFCVYSITHWQIRRLTHLFYGSFFPYNAPGLLQGQGYWLLNDSKDAPLFSGTGYSLPPNQQAVTLPLKQGWNQVGNPYLLTLSWQAVLAASAVNPVGGSLVVHKLQVADAHLGYRQIDTLPPFSGGFVYAEQPATLTFPLQRDTTLNGARLASQRYDAASWLESNFTLSSPLGSLPLGGLGLHPKASPQQDAYDEHCPPRWVNYLEVHFNHPGQALSKDMRPEADQQVWDFTVETNLAQPDWQLSWENYFREEDAQGSQLVLYNRSREQVVDMLSQPSSVVKAGERLRVVYGGEDFVRQHTLPERVVLGAAYPNPFPEGTVISFSLPASSQDYQVELSVEDSQGRELARLAEGVYGAGHHQVAWGGASSQGQRLLPGLYFCRLRVEGPVAASLTGKLLLR